MLDGEGNPYHLIITACTADSAAVGCNMHYASRQTDCTHLRQQGAGPALSIKYACTSLTVTAATALSSPVSECKSLARELWLPV
jgi:hypothetical protein